MISNHSNNCCSFLQADDQSTTPKHWRKILQSSNYINREKNWLCYLVDIHHLSCTGHTSHTWC